MIKRQINLNGKTVDFYDDLLDRYGLFETMRFAGGKSVDFDLHLERIQASCRKLSLPVYQPDSDIDQQVCDLAVKNNIKNPVVRLAWIDLDGKFTEFLSIRENPYNDSSIVLKLKAIEHSLIDEGANLTYKINNRKRYLQDKEQFKALGYDEVIYFHDNQIYEGAVTNVYVEKNGKLATPPLTINILPGIERKKIVAKTEAVEETVTIEDFISAKQIFVSNSLMGMVKGVIG